MNLRVISLLAVSSVVVWMTPACGGDSEEDGSGGTGAKDAGSDVFGGSSGTGGSAGSGGTGGSGGSTGGTGGGTGGTGGGTITCGGATCTPPQGLPVQVDSCCSTNNKCGITASVLGGQCIEQNQAGTLDPACPDQTVQGITLKGCCKPSGICGVEENALLMLGCFDPTQFTGGTPEPCGDGGTPDGGDAASDAPVVTDAGPG